MPVPDDELSSMSAATNWVVPVVISTVLPFASKTSEPAVLVLNE